MVGRGSGRRSRGPRQRQRRDQSRAARARENIELAAERRHALAQVAQADAAVRVHLHARDVEADSIVAHRQPRGLLGKVERHADLARARMPPDIGQRFLRDAE